jgi:hypothetical protein
MPDQWPKQPTSQCYWQYIIPSPVQVCEALDVQHMHLINEQHTRHQLSNTCSAANPMKRHALLAATGFTAAALSEP